MANYSAWHKWVLLLGLVIAVPAGAAEIFVQPSITISGEFNDNVFLSRQNQEADFITRISPALLLDYKAPFWQWSANAGVDYLHFARSSQENHFVPSVNLHGTTRLIQDLLFLEVTDYYIRVPLNTGYEGTFANQANQNFLTVSPYLKFHPQQRVELTTGYVYKNNTYDQANTIDWQEHSLFLRTAYEASPRTKYFLHLNHAWTMTSNDIDYRRLTPSAGIEHTYADGSRVSLEGGYSMLFTEDGRTVTSPYWNAGISHLFGSVLGTLNGGSSFNTDAYHNATVRQGVAGSLTKHFPRSTLGLSPYYYETTDQLTDSSFQESYGLTVFGTYSHSDRLQSHLSLTGGKERGTTFVNGPNQYGSSHTLVTLTSGLSYLLKDDVTLFCRYAFSSYFYDQDNLSNVYNNRFLIGATKRFQGWHF